jgi:hypothetical protein
MTGMLCLTTNDEPTYYYSSYNGKNMGGIRIPKAVMNKKRVKAHTPTQSAKSTGTKPYVSLVELGIPSDLNLFKQSALHSSDGLFDSIAWTTLDEVRGKFFGLRGYSFISYNEAKEFVHKLNLNSRDEWTEYCRSGKKPNNIPTEVSSVYSDEYEGMEIFLGYKKPYVDFLTAKNFAKSLNFKSTKQWNEYCKKNKLPAGISPNPQYIYKNKGWIGMNDFLGTGKISSQLLHSKFLTYKKAKQFAIKFNFNSKAEWKSFIKKNEIPKNIPRNPEISYGRNNEWKGWGDFLGTGRIANQLKNK